LTLAEWQPDGNLIISSPLTYSAFLTQTSNQFGPAGYHFASPPKSNALSGGETLNTPFWVNGSRIILAKAGCRPRGNRHRAASLGPSTWFINWSANGDVWFSDTANHLGGTRISHATSGTSYPRGVRYVFVELQGGGGGGSGSGTIIGGEGRGAGGGAWAFVEMRLNGTSGNARLQLGDRGAGGSNRGDGSDGGHTRLTIGSEWVQAGGGTRGMYMSSNGGGGGTVTTSGTLTNLRIVHQFNGGAGRNGNSRGEDRSLAFYNSHTPENEYIARSGTGGAAGSRGYAGGAAALGNGGDGRSNGGDGNSAAFNWSHYGGGGAGGGYAAFDAATGGHGSYGYGAVYY